jgi:hypothetical protein
MSAHILTFRGVTFFDSTSTGANGGASGVLVPSPMVVEVIEKPVPLGIGYFLKPGNAGPAVHTFDGTWRTTNPAGLLAIISSLGGLPAGLLTDTQWGSFANCVLDPPGTLVPEKTSDEHGYLIRLSLTFRQYP